MPCFFVSKLRTPIFIALVLVVSMAITDAVLAPAPAPEQPSFIDMVLASRAVVVAIRIAIVFAALFVVLSIVALIARRQWLTRVGPVEVSDRVSEFKEENQHLRERVDRQQGLIEGLKRQAVHTHQLLNRKQGS